MNPVSLLLRTTILTATVAGALALQSCDDRQYFQEPPSAPASGPAVDAPQNPNNGAYATEGDHLPPLPPPPTAPVAPPVKKYPEASRTDNPHYVVSPYKPHNVIDVSAFQSGQLAKDPSNNQIFRIP